MLCGAEREAICLYAQYCGSLKIIKSGWIFSFNSANKAVSTQTIIARFFISCN
jgi:hypothetical protein